MKKILICPLNWGLGHATRCIPIIKKILTIGLTPHIASDGEALSLLKNEFPDLVFFELPSYNIKYTQKSSNLKWKLLCQIPKIGRAISGEKKLIDQWIQEYKLDGIISDNRLGCFSDKIPSVYISHQINVRTGCTTQWSSWVHQFFIKKYKHCWVPDYAGQTNLAGKLSHPTNSKLDLIYIGALSSLHKQSLPILYDLMIVLSGPEPQRSLLEKKLKDEIQNYRGSIIFVKGIIEAEQKIEKIGQTTFYNFMNRREIETFYNQSKIVLCRSGYSSIMDLARLGKKAFFIPTPGQTEQLYLAKKLEREGIAPFCDQNNFKIEDLKKIEQYKGFLTYENVVDWDALFQVFENKKE